MNQGKNPKNTRKKNRNCAVYAVIGVLLAIAILLGLLRGCQRAPTTDPDYTAETPGIIYDENATQGGWDEPDTDKIVAGLNEKVTEGMINISMNTTPTFQDGSTAGNLMIVNEEINRYPQIVEISRNDTGELIYTSGAIAVGSKIETARLDTILPAGTYECTAMFYNVDPTTGAYLGCAGAIIHINILN